MSTEPPASTAADAALEALKRALTDAAADAAADVLKIAEHQLRAVGGPIVQTITATRAQVRIEVRLIDSSAPAGETGHPAGNDQGASRQAAGPHLTKLERAILAAATDQWRTKLELAAALPPPFDGHEDDSYFCGRVRRLKNLGLLETDGEGRYRLPQAN